jgi:hypothetical protein
MDWGFLMGRTRIRIGLFRTALPRRGRQIATFRENACLHHDLLQHFVQANPDGIQSSTIFQIDRDWHGK